MTTEKLIMAVEEDGLFLTLDDGSKWSIEVGDNTLVICWYETQRIVVKGGTSGNYRLKNLDTYSQEEVRATRTQ